MLRLLHIPASRLAAVLVALALSGVVRAVPPRPVGPHRCQCRAHGAEHECACPICSAAARRAKVAPAAEAEASLPPCHRAAAARERDADGDAERRRGAAACLVASCGVPEGGLAAPAGAEPFPLPRPPVLARAEWSAVLSAGARAAPDRVHAPELPPPRA